MVHLHKQWIFLRLILQLCYNHCNSKSWVGARYLGIFFFFFFFWGGGGGQAVPGVPVYLAPWSACPPANSDMHITSLSFNDEVGATCPSCIILPPSRCLVKYFLLLVLSTRIYFCSIIIAWLTTADSDVYITSISFIDGVGGKVSQLANYKDFIVSPSTFYAYTSIICYQLFRNTMVHLDKQWVFIRLTLQLCNNHCNSKILGRGRDIPAGISSPPR